MRNNRKGFTMAELLIVVAIIAVLVAVAIPVFNSSLEKSRDAVTLSNLRNAYAEFMVDYLNDESAALNKLYTVEVKGEVAPNGTLAADIAKALSIDDVTELPFAVVESQVSSTGSIASVSDIIALGGPKARKTVEFGYDTVNEIAFITAVTDPS